MKKLHLVVLCFIISLVSLGQEKLQNNIDSVSYSLGADIGANLKMSGATEMNFELFSKAMKEAFEGKESFINEQERRNIIRNYFQSLKSMELKRNKEEGEAFLNKNKIQKGVKVTESGLQYIVLKKGNGPIPTTSDKVKVHYHGTLIDGTVFDSSINRGEPSEFPLTGVIKGWQEVLQMMPVGSKWRVFIPTELAYGEKVRPGGPIGPNMMLIFEMELLEIKSQLIEGTD